MNPFPPKRTDSEPVPFLRSPLNVLLLLGGLILISIAVNGYLCFRSDHLSQIPLIFIQRDPDLFPRDWFFQNFGHFKLRFLHLILMRSVAWAVGIPLAIMFWYVICVASTLGAWLAIARHLYGSILPGLVTCLLAIIFYGEVGANHLIERALIPRTEAFAIIYWGVFCLLIGRPALAGLFFGAASCFQPAIGIQFGLPLMIWIAIAREPQRLKRVLWFLGCYLIVLLPWLLFLGGSFTGASNLSDQEIIHLVAWIRHPPLMVPRFFGRTVWVDFLLLLFASMWTWRQMARQNDRVRAAGWLLPIMGVFLFLAVVFIELIPVKAIVMFQPFRSSVLLYMMIFMMLGAYVLDLLRSSNMYRRFRGVFLLFSFYVLPLLGGMLILEVFFAWRERKGRSEPRLEFVLLTGLAFFGGYFIRPEVGGRFVTWGIYFGAVAATLVLHALTVRRFWERPGRVRGALVLFIVAGFGVIGSFFVMPWEKWLESEDVGTRTLAARVAWEYQLDPAPIMAIERLGVWARENTPRDALFVVPPDKSRDGFGIWSHRSIVFNVKFFPVTQEAYEEWRKRFFEHYGIEDASDPEEADLVQVALEDYGAKKIRNRYGRMSKDEILDLAGRYDAGYIITQTKYETPRLKLLRTDFDRTAADPLGNRLYLFEVVPG